MARRRARGRPGGRRRRGAADDLRRDVGARDPDRRGEPRPGLPGRRRSGPGGRGRGRRAAIRAQPVPAGRRDPRAARGGRGAPEPSLRAGLGPRHGGARDHRGARERHHRGIGVVVRLDHHHLVARLVTVGLVRDGESGAFVLDRDALRAAFGPRTRLVLVNSPHNPTGTVLTVDDLTELARLAIAGDVVVVTDEVYEHLTFDGVAHVPIATLPGMAERTLSISSAGKTLSFTGWKIGWVTGRAELVTAVRTVKQFLTYTSGAPLQPAVAAALADPDGRVGEYVRDLAASLAARRDLLCAGLSAAGFDVVVPSGTYFVVADGAAFADDGARLCRELPQRVGVVAVPVSAFCVAGSPTARDLRSWVRFTFVKRVEVLEQAVQRLAALG